jgi:endo-1,4-beta-xylanase
MVSHLMLLRRKALWLGLATGLGTIAGRTPLNRLLTSSLEPPREFSVSGTAPLTERAAARGILYGAAGNPKVLSDQELAPVFVRECGILVPENELKWTALRPSPTRFDFRKGDWLAEFAHSHDLLFRGHTLVWEQALPDWFEETVNAENAEQFLTEHITTVVQHYAGQMHSWDVVNEAIAVPYSTRSDGLRHSPWLQFLGQDYVELAFRVAAAADPQAMLVYNNHWLDYDTPRDNAQREAVLNLLTRLKANGTPVHALGIQAHLEGHETRFNPDKLREFLRSVASLGLKILITELDVADNRLPADIAVRDRIVASVYEDYLSVVLDEPAVMAVLTWGLSDRYTWLSTFTPRSDGAPVRPLPLDDQLNRKLAWNAMARAFDATDYRSPQINGMGVG